MKITRAEKIWLAAVLFFFVLYNLPGIPGYHDARGLVIHALLTVLPLWVSVYAGLFKIFRQYRLKK